MVNYTAFGTPDFSLTGPLCVAKSLAAKALLWPGNKWPLMNLCAVQKHFLRCFSCVKSHRNHVEGFQLTIYFAHDAANMRYPLVIKGRFINYGMGGAGVFAPRRSFLARVKERGKFFWNDQKSGTNFFRMTKMGVFSRILAVYCVFEAGRTISVTSKERDEKFQQMHILG